MNKEINTYENKTDKNLFGFWVYLMTDLTMFAALFATYAVLKNNTFGDISIQEMFHGPFVLIETMILLVSSFTCGLTMLAAHSNAKGTVLSWLGITCVLGISFISMELSEFTQLFQEGHTFQKSAFLSSYFTLVGTHGLHIIVGLFWMGLLIVQVIRRGITGSMLRKLTLLSLFWHFLDIVWIFIFTIVYLLGGIQ